MSKEGKERQEKGAGEEKKRAYYARGGDVNNAQKDASQDATFC